MEPVLEKRIKTLGPDEFRVLVPQFQSLSLVSEIQAERLKNEELRNQWFYCGDGSVYGLKGRDVFLHLTDFPNNPLIKDPERASQELLTNHNFLVDRQTASDLEARASSSDGVVSSFNLSELPIQGENDEWGYVEISASKLAEGKRAFKTEYGNKVAALFDRVHGDAVYGKDGIGDLLSKEGRTNTRIYMLNEGHAREVLERQEAGTMFARASYLDWFGSHSDVNLDFRDVDDHRFARGVVKGVAAGDAQKNLVVLPYEDALAEAGKIAPKGTPFNSIIVSLVDKLYKRQ